MTNRIQTNLYNVQYPPQAPYNENCFVNQTYQTLPEGWPRKLSPVGPSSIKHIYTGIPNYYPIRYINNPNETLYDADFSQFGVFGKRISYGAKLYPYTDRYNREVEEYADFILPQPDLRNYTQYPVVRDAKLSSWRL